MAGKSRWNLVFTFCHFSLTAENDWSFLHLSNVMSRKKYSLQSCHSTIYTGLIWMFLWSYCILVFFLLQMTLSSSVSQNTYLRLFQIASHLVMCLRVSFIINRFHFLSSFLVELLFWKTLCNCGNFQLAQLKFKVKKSLSKIIVN